MLKHGPEANRLYWQTDRSIADIAETLGISRRALYELVTPEATGVNCENCGTEVVYVNRSAKAGSLGRCPACGTECQIDYDVSVEETVPPYAAGWPALSDPEENVLRTRVINIGAAAVAGAALGAITAYLFVRKR